MATDKKEDAIVSPAPSTRRNATPREVLAARMKNIEDRGLMTPKMQRQVDRMIANIERGKK